MIFPEREKGLGAVLTASEMDFNSPGEGSLRSAFP